MPDVPPAPAPRWPARLAGWIRTAERWAGRDRHGTRDVLVDVLFVVLPLLLMYAAEAGRPAPAEAVAGWVAGPLLWFRHRWALVLLPVVTAASFLVGDLLQLHAIMLLFTVAVHRPLRWSLPAAAGVLAAFAADVVRDPGDPGAIPSALAVVTVLVGLVVGWGLLVRRRRARARRAVADEAARLQARADAVRAAERRRIIEELYDTLADRIHLVERRAAQVAAARPAGLSAEVSDTVDVIRANAEQAVVELREVVGLFGGAAPDAERAGLAQLPDLVGSSRRSGVAVTFRDAVSGAGSLPDVVGRTVYRVVQEALTNARKHAPGAAVGIDLSGRAGAGLVLVVSNGRPASGSGAGIPGAGAGLVGIGERVALVGGEFTHGPTEDGGFRITARLPWTLREAGA